MTEERIKQKTQKNLLVLSEEINKAKKTKNTSALEKILWNTIQTLSSSPATKAQIYKACKNKGHPIAKARNQCFCGIRKIEENNEENKNNKENK